MGHMRIETVGGSVEADATGVDSAFLADLMQAGGMHINLAAGVVEAPEVVVAAPDISLEQVQSLCGRLAIEDR
jgi:hypothetical protein